MNSVGTAEFAELGFHFVFSVRIVECIGSGFHVTMSVRLVAFALYVFASELRVIDPYSKR